VTFLLGQNHYGLGNYARAIDLLVQNVAAVEVQPLVTHRVGPARLSVTARCFLARALAPRAIPSQDALAADPQAPGDGTLRLSSRGKQPRGLLPTNFQSVEIPSWCNMSGHAPIVQWEGAVVTILCETQ
jgi:hypothetical protein